MTPPRVTRRLTLIGLVAVAALPLAACGDDTSSAVSPAGTVDGASARLTSVMADVERVAVGLEQYSFRNGYARDLSAALTSLKLSDISVRKGHTVASYEFDDVAQEFKVCVQDASGAWATYDTAPMSVREAEESGGCPP